MKLVIEIQKKQKNIKISVFMIDIIYMHFTSGAIASKF